MKSFKEIKARNYKSVKVSETWITPQADLSARLAKMSKAEKAAYKAELNKQLIMQVKSFGDRAAYFVENQGLDYVKFAGSGFWGKSDLTNELAIEMNVAWFKSLFSFYLSLTKESDRKSFKSTFSRALTVAEKKILAAEEKYIENQLFSE